MDLTPILLYIQTLDPIVHTILVVLGSIVTVGTAVDTLLPSLGLHKIVTMPILGPVFTALARFSPFNIAPKV